jgi:glycosyltransferase involved in cell wall biosynthesis
VPQLTIARPWAGLYLRNHHHGERPSPLKSLRLLAKGDGLIRSPLCRGVGVLDERFVSSMTRHARREVTAFPDVTDDRLPSRPYPLAEEIRRRAAGRKVIGLLGLERRKGLPNLLRVAARARELRLPWYFACAGRYARGEYDEAEHREIEAAARGAADGSIDNLHLELPGARIPAEEDFNDVFRTFDLAWAAYEGFEGSSGTLGKAAAFGIPCLATRGECIGHRVESYRTGLTIPEGDSERALEAIGRILDGRDWDDAPLRPDYARFREDHGVARLDMLLGRLLDSV